MKKWFIAILLLTAASFAIAEGKTQTTCPVMGGKVTAKSPHVDVKGFRIYVCCPGCIDKIKADPEKYIKKMKAEGVEPTKSPDGKNTKQHNQQTH